MSERFYATGYADARARFLAAAKRAGGRVASLELTARGPGGETLATDLCWIGAARPRCAMIHVCGVHGVEALPGSAVQLAWMDRATRPPAAEAAIALIHVVNPFGMAWRRRVNENNVDLNRNCLPPGEAYSGAPPLYHRLDPLLNPPSPPSADGFYLRAAAQIARFGLGPLQRAVAGGQYEYPRGLFFGGRELEEGPAKLLALLADRLRDAESVSALDLHTGLGAYGRESLFEHSSAHGGVADRAAPYAAKGSLWISAGARSPVGRAALRVAGDWHAASPAPAARLAGRESLGSFWRCRPESPGQAEAARGVRAARPALAAGSD